MTEFLTYFKLRMPDIDKFELCYVDEDTNTAYFTDNFEDQWGDDWDDVPYEHNAGEPYLRDGSRVLKIKFEGDFRTPNYGTDNSSYSVEYINMNDVPWLSAKVWVEQNTPMGPIWDFEPVPIALPRTTVLHFIEAIKQFQGQVYIPMEMDI